MGRSLPGSKLLPVLCALVGWLLPDQADARGIPIIFGNGDTIVSYDLPAEFDAQVSQIIPDTKFGYCYTRAHAYYLDLWTWNGRYVLYRNDQIWELTPSGVDDFRDRMGKAFPSPPLLYWCPSALCLIGGIVMVVVAYNALRQTDEQRAAKLLNDPRYQSAIEMLMKSLQEHAARKKPPAPAPEFDPATDTWNTPASSEDPDDAQFQKTFDEAVTTIVDRGVPHEKAVENLNWLLVHVVSTQSNDDMSAAEQSSPDGFRPDGQ